MDRFTEDVGLEASAGEEAGESAGEGLMIEMWRSPLSTLGDEGDGVGECITLAGGLGSGFGGKGAVDPALSEFELDEPSSGFAAIGEILGQTLGQGVVIEQARLIEALEGGFDRGSGVPGSTQAGAEFARGAVAGIEQAEGTLEAATAVDGGDERVDLLVGENVTPRQAQVDHEQGVDLPGGLGIEPQAHAFARGAHRSQGGDGHARFGGDGLGARLAGA